MRPVAVVTGAGGGMGAAIVRTLAESDLTVVAVDVDAAALDDVVAKASADGLDVRSHVADLTDAAKVDGLVEHVEHVVGPITQLVIAAGVLRMGPALGYPVEDWAATFAVNTTAAFLVSRKVAQGMVARREGAIVTVASNAAAVGRKNMSAYAASKAALAAYTRCLGLELSDHGIRCNVVAPGSTDTPMLRAMLGPSDDAVIDGSLADHKIGIPLGRVARPEDIAAAVRFLLSDDARHITMHTLTVDGGATLGSQ